MECSFCMHPAAHRNHCYEMQRDPTRIRCASNCLIMILAANAQLRVSSMFRIMLIENNLWFTIITRQKRAMAGERKSFFANCRINSSGKSRTRRIVVTLIFHEKLSLTWRLVARRRDLTSGDLVA